MSNLSGRETLPANVTLLNHPVVDTAITRLRICKGGKTYTDLVTVVGGFLAIEATRDLPTKEWAVTTRMFVPTVGRDLSGRVGLVDIARGGNDLVAAFRNLLPESSIYRVTARRETREEDGKKVVYARLIDSKLPKKLPKGMETLIVLDPMFASGCSLELVLNLLNDLGAKHVVFVCTFAAPEGMDFITKRFPNVRIVMAQLDEKLDENSYIVPGIGDGGDISNLTEHE